MDIEEKEIYDDVTEKEKDKEPLSNQQKDENQSKFKDEKEKDSFENADISSLEGTSEKDVENENLDESESIEGTQNKKAKKLFSDAKQKYKIYTNKFDEIVRAEDLESEEELIRLRSSLDQQLIQLKNLFLD